MYQPRGRHFQSRISPRRDRFNERSRERSTSRDRHFRRSNRDRPKKYERRWSREKTEAETAVERYSRGARDRFEASGARDRTRRSRSAENRWPFESNVPDRPVELPNYEEVGNHQDRQFANSHSHEKLNFEPYQSFEQGYRKDDVQNISSKLSHVSEVEAPVPEYSQFSPASHIDILDDKPDPWNNTTVHFKPTPTFGQEKSSSLIPEFDPDGSDVTSRSWVKHINKVGREKNWTFEEKKFHFSTKLIGRAKEWFMSGSKILEPWKTLKKQFVTAFPSDMDFHNLLALMMNYKKVPEENLSTYFNYKMALLSNCSITGRKAVSCLIGGLDESVIALKNDAYDKNFATPEELYEFLNTKNVDGPPNDSKVKTTCFFCKKVGHVIANCPSKEPNATRASESNILPKTKPDSKKKDAKYYKEIFIQNVLLMACYDENFPNITIREKDASIAKIKYRRQISVIQGYNKDTITVLGQTQVRIKVDLVECEAKIYIVRDEVQNTPVLLGESIRKYLRCIQDENGVHFLNLEKEVTRRSDHDRPPDRPIYDELVPRSSYERKLHDRPEDHRYDKNYNQFMYEQRVHIQSSPIRSPPGRSFVQSHPFLSKSMYAAKLKEPLPSVSQLAEVLPVEVPQQLSPPVVEVLNTIPILQGFPLPKSRRKRRAKQQASAVRYANRITKILSQSDSTTKEADELCTFNQSLQL